MLRKSFFKKLCPSGRLSKDQTRVATEKFLRVNRSLSEDYQFGAESEAESWFYDLFVDHLNQALDTCSLGGVGYADLTAEMGPGPGASQLADSSELHAKLFRSKFSYTDPDLIMVYRCALSDSGVWAEAEKLRSERFGFERVQGGRMFFVPKNVDEARSCCTEPLLNMIVQLGIGRYIERRLKEYFGINLSTQPAVNRELAQLGSRDGSYGTIDLSSASDSIGLSLCSKIIRPSFLKRLLMMSRCSVVSVPGHGEERLRMISTMGNGFTFPLETAIFASAARAAVDLTCPGSRYSVFGDDIVVPKEAFGFLCKMLEKLEFRVNGDKSFNSGGFRESCGHDYYMGHLVRGIYVRSLETPTAVYSAINRLARWSAYTGVSLPKTLSLLRSMAPDIRVPPSESVTAGVHVPFRLSKRPRLTPSYWFKYRRLSVQKRARFVDEPTDDNGEPLGLDVTYYTSILWGIHSHSWWRNEETGEAGHGPLTCALREFPGSPQRVKMESASIPFWDYVPSNSELDCSWLPGPVTKGRAREGVVSSGQHPKTLSRFDLDAFRVHQCGSYDSWKGVVEAFFSAS
jgi:hypothetical protein